MNILTALRINELNEADQQKFWGNMYQLSLMNFIDKLVSLGVATKEEVENLAPMDFSGTQEEIDTAVGKFLTKLNQFLPAEENTELWELCMSEETSKLLLDTAATKVLLVENMEKAPEDLKTWASSLRKYIDQKDFEKIVEALIFLNTK